MNRRYTFLSPFHPSPVSQAGEKGGKVFSSSFTNSTSSSQASTAAGGSSGLQSSRAKTAPAKEVK